MHAVGIHSALAIKRQRRRRDEQRRAKERRYSTQSEESCDGSLRRKQHHGQSSNSNADFLDTKSVSSIGMLHVGVVFAFFGVFLLGAGLLPDDMSNWDLSQPNAIWNELVFSGLFALGLGIFLIVLNSFISKREEEDLEDYVQRQLTRSRSGHRLERDYETGVLTTRQHRRIAELQKDRTNDSLSQTPVTPVTSELQSPVTPQDVEGSNDMLLEKILEEDSAYSYGDEFNRREVIVSPNLNNDKRYLVGSNGHAVHMTNI